MAWADEIEDGITELESDGAGVMITKWNRSAVSIPAIQGSGMSYESLLDGGFVDNENPSFTIRRAAIEAERPGCMFKQGDKMIVSGKTLKISRISFDPSDPCVRISTEGEEQ